MSVVLTLSVICVTVLPVCAAGEAGSTGGSKNGGSWGAATEWNVNNDMGSIRILPSALNDTEYSTADKMADDKYRYGNGTSVHKQYSIFISVPDTNASHSSKFSVNSLSSLKLSNYFKESNLGNTASEGTIIYDAKQEYDKMQGTVAERYKSGVGTSANGCELTSVSGSSGNYNMQYIRFSNSKTGSISKKCESVFMEDFIMNIMNGKRYSSKDKVAFWYFYTRLVIAANSDVGILESGAKSTLGNTMNKVINAVKADGDNAIDMFKHGYKVALKAIYFDDGSSAIDDTKADSLVNNMGSILVERMECVHVGDPLITTNDIDNWMLSVSDYIKIASYCYFSNGLPKSAESNYMREKLVYLEDCDNGKFWSYDNNFAHYYGVPFMFGDWDNLEGEGGFVDVIYPVKRVIKDNKVYTKEVTNSSGQRLFGGWAYYSLGDNKTDLMENLALVQPDTVNLASEITYNAYLSSKGNYSEKNTFGENGRVMTDTVYLSGMSELNVKKLKDSQSYVSTTVDKTIKLSTPVVDTNYELKNLSYRVTNAHGTVAVTGEQKTTDTLLSKQMIFVYGTMLKSALSASNIGDIQYKYRLKISEEETDIAAGSYKLYKYVNGKLQYVTTTNSVTSKNYIIGEGYKVSDADTKSHNVYYLRGKDENGNDTNKYYPVCKLSGVWYYCPVVKYTDLLVQIRADYFGKYDKNSTFKSVAMPEYLVAQNNSTSDFTKKNVYSMIDNFATNAWGRLSKRGYTVTTVVNGKATDTSMEDYLKAKKFSDTSSYSFLWKTLYDIFGNPFNNYSSVPDNAMKNTDTAAKVTVNDKVVNSKIQYLTSLAKTALTVSYRSNSLQSSLSTSHYFVRDGKKTNLGELVKKSYGYTSSDGIKTLGYSSAYPAEKNINSTSNNGKMKGVSVTGYKQSDFAKLVVTYENELYTLRGKMATVSAPNIAKWIAGMDAKASVLSMTSSNTSKTVSPVLNKDCGFYRYGQGSKAGWVNWITNNDGIDTSYASVQLMRGADSRFASLSTPIRSNISLIEPFTQSCVDIPITLNFNTYTPKDITPTAPSTSYSSSGSTLTESSYVDKDLYVYPEVTMWAENDKSSSPSSDTTYTSIVTVGQKKRNIPIVAYNTLNLTTPNHNPTITGTAIAFDTRAKALAERLGASKAPVFYSGSGINVAIDNTTVGSVSTYYLDIGNSTLKTAWGNSDIAAKNIASEFANRLSASVSSKVDIKNGDTIVKTLDFGGTGSKDCSIAVDDPVSTNETIELTVKGGILTKVKYLENGLHANYTVINALSDDVSLAFDSTASNTISANSSTELALRAKVLAILKGTKVVGKNNMLVQSLQNGGGTEVNNSLKNWLYKINGGRFTTANGWYMEDSSVLVIKGYETNLKVTGVAYTDQIPLNLGPATPADKNNYFSNGYKGIINSTYAFRYKRADGTVVPYVFQTSTFNNKTDFIVADVTINDATTY